MLLCLMIIYKEIIPFKTNLPNDYGLYTFGYYGKATNSWNFYFDIEKRNWN
jgi:hypothetical protein